MQHSDVFFLQNCALLNEARRGIHLCVLDATSDIVADEVEQLLLLLLRLERKDRASPRVESARNVTDFTLHPCSTSWFHAHALAVEAASNAGEVFRRQLL